MTSYTKRPGFARELAGTGYIRETDAIRVQAENSSQFGEFITVSRTPIIELNSAYGTSAIRDIVTTAGSGAKDDVNGSITTGEIELSTGTTASSSVLLESAEVARYIPGYSAELGIGARLPTAPTGEQVARWGGRTFEGNDGFYFIYDATGLGICRQKAGTENIVYQSSWNFDKLDGTGPSGITLDLTLGHIFQIDYTWYGYGGIRFSVVDTLGEFQRPIPVHYIAGDDVVGTTIEDPSLQIFAEVENGATTSDYTMYVGGRQYSIVGKYVPKYRFTGDTRAGVTVGTTLLPLISFREKTGYQNRSVKLREFNGVNTGSATARMVIILDGTLTGASWGTPTNYTAAETALEVDKSATAISGGNVLWQGSLITGGVGTAVGLGGADVDLDLPAASTITLCAQTFSSTTTLQSGLIMQEEW